MIRERAKNGVDEITIGISTFNEWYRNLGPLYKVATTLVFLSSVISITVWSFSDEIRRVADEAPTKHAQYEKAIEQLKGDVLENSTLYRGLERDRGAAEELRAAALANLSTEMKALTDSNDRMYGEFQELRRELSGHINWHLEHPSN